MVAIFVVLTIIAFILVDAAVQRSQFQEVAPASKRESAGAVLAAFEDTSLPRGLFLDPGHTWISLLPDGATRVGMDHFAQQAIGRMDAIDLPHAGQEVRQGDDLFAVRQGSRRANFRSPMEGVVQSVNSNLPESVTALDPYENGWICTLKPRNLAQTIRRLPLAEEASAWLKTEINRFRDFVSSQAILAPVTGPVLQDGGRVVTGVLELMDDKAWKLFQQGFLGTR